MIHVANVFVVKTVTKETSNLVWKTVTVPQLSQCANYTCPATISVDYVGMLAFG